MHLIVSLQNMFDVALRKTPVDCHNNCGTSQRALVRGLSGGWNTWCATTAPTTSGNPPQTSTGRSRICWTWRCSQPRQPGCFSWQQQPLADRLGQGAKGKLSEEPRPHYDLFSWRCSFSNAKDKTGLIALLFVGMLGSRVAGKLWEIHKCCFFSHFERWK